jgi:hypothetical protein
MSAGGYVKKNQFIRALIVISDGQFDRVADIAQFARFSLTELHAARDVPSMHIQTRNNALGEHR